MPKAPVFLTSFRESTYGRPGQVVALRECAPGFVDLRIRAEPPAGGWRPAHEIEFRVAPTLARHYTVSRVEDDGVIAVLVDMDADGPGTWWVQALRPAAEIVVIATRHRPMSLPGSRRLYLGDGSALGAIDAHATAATERPTVVIEVQPAAVPVLRGQYPGYTFLATTGEPGAVLDDWLTTAIAAGSLAQIDGAVLLGHAQSLQRQRRRLVQTGALSRRSITVKPYWSTGKEGL
jgi:NADPH-dependent ferric siderophore reductase